MHLRTPNRLYRTGLCTTVRQQPRRQGYILEPVMFLYHLIFLLSEGRQKQWSREIVSLLSPLSGLPAQQRPSIAYTTYCDVLYEMCGNDENPDKNYKGMLL